MDNTFRTVTKSGESLIEVKRSKFLGLICHVSSREEAEDIISAERKKYHDAKHHCSAYIIRGENGAPDTLHSSDDGEPSGTAGAPMLEIIKGDGLKDVCLVVTRYFGGTLLGTGGLVRAYSDAAHAALEASTVSEMVLMQNFSAGFDYTYTGSIDHYITSKGISRTSAEYTDRVTYSLACREEDYTGIIKDLTDLTASTADIEKGNLDYVSLT